MEAWRDFLTKYQKFTTNFYTILQPKIFKKLFEFWSQFKSLLNSYQKPIEKTFFWFSHRNYNEKINWFATRNHLKNIFWFSHRRCKEKTFSVPRNLNYHKRKKSDFFKDEFFSFFFKNTLLKTVSVQDSLKLTPPTFIPSVTCADAEIT